MDSVALASAMVGAKAAQTQVAVAAEMMKMNADAAASIVQVLEAAQQNINKLANVAAGVGGTVDISA
jgi:hypothetical protein